MTRRSSTVRWTLTVLSFVLMFGASAWVLSSSWPASGMPGLPIGAHLAAALTVCLETVTRALKFKASSHAIGWPLRFSTSLRVCLGGDFAAAITPARSGAEPARFLVLAESGMPAPVRVLVLFIELFLEMCSLALVCVLLALVFRGRGTSTGGLLGLVGGYSVAVIGAGAVGVLLARHHAHGPPPALARRVGLHAGRWRAVQRTLRALGASARSLQGANWWIMLVAFVGSVVHVICKVATLPLIVYVGDPSFPLTMDSLAPLVLWPLALFYGGVVVPAPGGGGFVEGAFALTLRSAIPVALFAASLVWWRFYTFYLYIIVGGIAAGDAALRAIRRQGDAAHIH